MTASVEDLLRESAMTYGHIQLFRDDAGWAVSIQHYGPIGEPPPGKAFTLGIFDDPVDGLRKALIEDERRTRDLERKYAAAKGAPPRAAEPTVAPEPHQVDLEEYIAEVGGRLEADEIADAAEFPIADPMAGMFG